MLLYSPDDFLSLIFMLVSMSLKCTIFRWRRRWSCLLQGEPKDSILPFDTRHGVPRARVVYLATNGKAPEHWPAAEDLVLPPLDTASREMTTTNPCPLGLLAAAAASVPRIPEPVEEQGLAVVKKEAHDTFPALEDLHVRSFMYLFL